MRLLIVPVTSDAGGDPLRLLFEPPVARYVDAGTAGVLNLPFESLLGPEFSRVAAAAGVEVSRGLAEPHAGSVHIDPPQSLSAFDTARCDAWLAEGGRLCVLLTSNTSVAAWGLVGFGLPSFGWVSDCSRDDLWITWCRLAGGAPIGSGRDLLEEPEAAVHAEGEAQLSDRLRMLYGE